MTLKFFWFTLIDKTFNCLVYWLCEFYLFALRIGELSVQTKYRNSNARVCYPTSTGQPPPLSLQSLVKSNSIHFVSISPFNPILHDRKWSNNNDLTYIRLSNLREYPQSEDWTEMRERPRDHHINLISFSPLSVCLVVVVRMHLKMRYRRSISVHHGVMDLLVAAVRTMRNEFLHHICSLDESVLFSKKKKCWWLFFFFPPFLFTIQSL